MPLCPRCAVMLRSWIGTPVGEENPLVVVPSSGFTSPTGVPTQLRNIDRKSTRLNSSHVEISYADFCLKKKTTQRPCSQVTDRLWILPRHTSRQWFQGSPTFHESHRFAQTL